ncbi:MAG: protein-glutamate O-methyltransferase CheR [Actinobacteria bacterium]|nr:protein-glutamate O-methyltransferase CheR [Actinomycetota bacterium]
MDAARLLAEVAGLRTLDERSYRTAAAIEEAMGAAGVAGTAYRHLLERDAASFQDLVRRVTVAESHFFREPRQFELLRRRMLPELLRDRSASHRLQIWSAGCSSGEEAYSVAILLEELGLADRADVRGTDISAAALQRARDASYRPWSMRGVSDARRRAYFRAEGDHLQLERRFAQRVTFEVLNLVADPYPVPSSGVGFDVILCRNVLIYLTPEAIAAVVRRLVGALAPDGWLMTASSDPHLSSQAGLEAVVTEHGVVYRRVPTTSTTVPGGTGTRNTSLTGGRSATAAASRVRRRGDPHAADRAARPQAASVPVSEVPRPEAEYVRATTLLAEGRWEEAVRAARSALYLQPDLVVAQVAFGRAALHVGDLAGAGRAWRQAQALLEGMDPDAPVPLAGGASAGRLLAELSVLNRRSAEVPR